MSHFGTHAHGSRQIFTSNKKECDLRLELAASKATWPHWFKRNKAFCTKTDNRTYAQVVCHKNPCISVIRASPKLVPVKQSVDKAPLDSHNCETPARRIHMKRPLHNKCRHVTAPVLVNNRFQVLATHADTSNAVLDDTHVDKPTHQQYRVCKQRLVDTKPSDVDICRPDPDCSVPPIGSQVSKNTSVSTRVKNDIGSSTVSSKSSHCSDILQSSQNGNISLSSQPNAARTIHLLDFKANVDVSKSTYSNTAILFLYGKIVISVLIFNVVPNKMVLNLGLSHLPRLSYMKVNRQVTNQYLI